MFFSWPYSVFCHPSSALFFGKWPAYRRDFTFVLLWHLCRAMTRQGMGYSRRRKHTKHPVCELITREFFLTFPAYVGSIVKLLSVAVYVSSIKNKFGGASLLLNMMYGSHIWYLHDNVKICNFVDEHNLYNEKWMI